MVLAMPRALFPEVADERFGGPSAVGWLFAAISIGAVISGLSSGWIGRVRRQGVALTVAIVGWGAAVALSGLGRVLWVTVALLAVAGAADLVSAVLRQTILRCTPGRDAPAGYAGRVRGGGRGRARNRRPAAGATAAVARCTFSWVAGGTSASIVLDTARGGTGAGVPAVRRVGGTGYGRAAQAGGPAEPSMTPFTAPTTRHCANVAISDRRA
jgi:hypothetical protein